MRNWCKWRSSMQHRSDGWNETKKSINGRWRKAVGGILHMSVKHTYSYECAWIQIAMLSQKRITFAPQVTYGACPLFPGISPITWWEGDTISLSNAEKQKQTWVAAEVTSATAAITDFLLCRDLFLVSRQVSCAMSPSNTNPFHSLFFFHTRFILMMMHGLPSWYP